MAITVARASSQYAEAPSSCLGAGTLTTFTLAGWYKPSSIANGTVIGIGRSSTAPYIAMGMDGSGAVFIEVSDGAGVNVTGGTLTNGVWSHIGGVQASATSRAAYLNGAAGTTNTTSKSPAGLDRTTLGGLVLNGSRLSFAGGDIGECGVWNVALTTAEMLILAAGASPLVVRPQSLVFYAPLTMATSPEQDLRGALALTFGASTAAPTKATSHPRVFKPVPFATVVVPTSAGTVDVAPVGLAGATAASPVAVATAGTQSAAGQGVSPGGATAVGAVGAAAGVGQAPTVAAASGVGAATGAGQAPTSAAVGTSGVGAAAGGGFAPAGAAVVGAGASVGVGASPAGSGASGPGAATGAPGAAAARHSLPALGASAVRALVPAYFYPSWYLPGGSEWDVLEADARGVSYVVMNQDSGMGTSSNSDYALEVGEARAAGLQVLAYVPTGYAATPVADVKGWMQNHRDWYDVDGFFVDEASVLAGDVPYYAELRAWADANMAAGHRTLVLNHGAVPDEGYAAVGDVLVTFEGVGASYAGASFPAWLDGYSPSRFAHIVHTTAAADWPAVRALAGARRVGHLYVTDNAFSALPSYWQEFQDSLSVGVSSGAGAVFPGSSARAGAAAGAAAGTGFVAGARAVAGSGSSSGAGAAPVIAAAAGAGSSAAAGAQASAAAVAALGSGSAVSAAPSGSSSEQAASGLAAASGVAPASVASEAAGPGVAAAGAPAAAAAAGAGASGGAASSANVTGVASAGLGTAAFAPFAPSDTQSAFLIPGVAAGFGVSPASVAAGFASPGSGSVAGAVAGAVAAAAAGTGGAVAGEPSPAAVPGAGGAQAAPGGAGAQAAAGAGASAVSFAPLSARVTAGLGGGAAVGAAAGSTAVGEVTAGAASAVGFSPLAGEPPPFVTLTASSGPASNVTASSSSRATRLEVSHGRV